MHKLGCSLPNTCRWLFIKHQNKKKPPFCGITWPSVIWSLPPCPSHVSHKPPPTPFSPAHGPNIRNSPLLSTLHPESVPGLGMCFSYCSVAGHVRPPLYTWQIILEKIPSCTVLFLTVIFYMIFCRSPSKYIELTWFKLPILWYEIYINILIWEKSNIEQYLQLANVGKRFQGIWNFQNAVTKNWPTFTSAPWVEERATHISAWPTPSQHLLSRPTAGISDWEEWHISIWIPPGVWVNF